MQIIAELEGTTLGPYAGCVGYFSFNGNLDTCITIRTALSFPPQPSSVTSCHPFPSDGRGRML